MGDVIRELTHTPWENLCIVAGLAFLALAVVGKISGKIEPGLGGRIVAGVLGSALFVGGLVSHVRQHAISETKLTAADVSVQKQEQAAPAVVSGSENSVAKHVDTAIRRRKIWERPRALRITSRSPVFR